MKGKHQASGCSLARNDPLLPQGESSGEKYIHWHISSFTWRDKKNENKKYPVVDPHSPGTRTSLSYREITACALGGADLFSSQRSQKQTWS